ncbi:PepSY-associated TM helix domain-containing protein [Acetobacter sp. LMG 32666]|uniref:PepSY-associated TM helix domain-containing protein n=1 Tax=Acetobacter sp. LMG 32666 TaxID=2959295 RepID=UPI0030C85A52
MTPARRSRLAWLHRWAGLVTGWAAFAIFVTGTLALFDTELTRWMQPETALIPHNARLTPRAIDRAQQILLESDHAGDPPSFLLLPEPRDPTLRVLHYDGHSFVGPVLDPQTGQTLPARQTEGGNFFFNFHYTLRIPSPWGERLVAGIAFAFAAIVLSGVLLHLKRLVPDYFTLRLKASMARSLLDIHVLTGSAMLPFHIMITWTGLILTAENALPVLQFEQPAPIQEGVAQQTNPHWAPQASLSRMLQQAHARLGIAPSYVLFDDGKTTLSGIRQNSLNSNDLSVTFDSQSGEFLSKTREASQIEDAFYILNGLHLGRSMGPMLRWLWFGGGLASSVMVASGLIYYTARQKKQPAKTFHLAQRLNIALIGGLVTACLSIFVFNRLIPALWAARSTLEVAGFFGVWAGCLLLAMFLPLNKSWRIIAWTTGVLGLAIPAIDGFTAPLAAWGTPLHLSVNSLCALTGLIALGSLRMLPDQVRHD